MEKYITLTYSTEQLAQQLKAQRENRGLSQRALSRIAGVPQSHISKIENNAVDLRLSSFVAIARALDLDLMLVPKKALPAVQSIVGNIAGSTSEADKRPAYRLDD